VISAVKYLEPSHRLRVAHAVASTLRASPPDNLMLTSGGVAALHRAGMQVGAHTVSHPILTSLPPDVVRQEMQGSKSQLEQLIGAPVTLFAYPNGRPGDDYDEHAVATARQVGFEAAFTTVRGAAHRGTDPFQIPRFTPWDRTPLRFGLRMLQTLWASRQGGAAPGALASAQVPARA
jgi:peptidoglycan/xylan/chitin deacetylase (PgdA/CDA1 family)